MTPERERYLAKCNKREKYLRKKIADCKLLIKLLKYAIYINLGAPYYYNSHQCLREKKYEYSAYRHELARLKGMDRVVVPREARYELILEGYTGYCYCGNFLMENCLNKKANIHCDKCGRRILWKKVSE